MQGSKDPPTKAASVSAHPTVDAWCEKHLERCGVRVRADGTVLVIIQHGKAVPDAWFETASYAITCGDHTDPIPCTARIMAAEPLRHELTLTPPKEMVMQLGGSDRSALSNVVAVIVTAKNRACILRNVFDAAALERASA